MKYRSVRAVALALLALLLAAGAAFATINGDNNGQPAREAGEVPATPDELGPDEWGTTDSPES